MSSPRSGVGGGEYQAEAEGTFSVKVGRLVAGQVERALRKGAFDYGLQIKVDRQVGLLNGYLFVTVEGDADDVKGYLADVDAWAPATDGRGESDD